MSACTTITTQWYDSPIPVKVDLTTPTATAIATNTVTQSSTVIMQPRTNNKITPSTNPHR